MENVHGHSFKKTKPNAGFDRDWLIQVWSGGYFGGVVQNGTHSSYRFTSLYLIRCKAGVCVSVFATNHHKILWNRKLAPEDSLHAFCAEREQRTEPFVFVIPA